MSDFANLADGGARLAPLLQAASAEWSLRAEPLLLAVLPNGAPVALGIRAQWPLEVRGLPVHRSDDGAVVAPDPDLAGRDVVVVDDGVETGTVARAVADALRRSEVGRLVLAVPVCPREALADLQHRYDDVVAAVRPLARRSLTWHYDDFDVIGDDEARRLLSMPPA